MPTAPLIPAGRPEAGLPADATAALTGAWQRLCRARGWSAAVLLDTGEHGLPGTVLATWGVLPAEARTWAAHRPARGLRVFGHLVGFACAVPENPPVPGTLEPVLWAEDLLALVLAALPRAGAPPVQPAGRSVTAPAAAPCGAVLARGAVRRPHVWPPRPGTRAGADLRAVLGAMSEGVLLTDLHGEALLVNRAFCDLLGVKSIPRHWPDLVAKFRLRDCRAADNPLPCPLRLAGTEGGVCSHHLRGCTRQGRPVVLAVTAAPVRNARGDLVGAVMVAADDTTPQRLREERRAFAVAAAHELRTPLTALLLEVQLLSRAAARGELASAWDPHVRRLTRSAQRLRVLAQSLANTLPWEQGAAEGYTAPSLRHGPAGDPGSTPPPAQGARAAPARRARRG